MNKSTKFPSVEIRMVKDYIVVYSEQYDVRIAAGRLSEDRILMAIGLAVLKGITEVSERMRHQDPRQGEQEKSYKWIGIGLAARQLQTSISSVRRMIAAGTLISVRTVGGHRRILQGSVDAAMVHMKSLGSVAVASAAA